MVDSLRKPNEKTLLPFALYPEPNETFNGAVEKAAVFCLAELDRDKGGGFLRKQQPEKLVFVSKAYYPFWVAPFKEFTVLLDGLNSASHTISYPSIPDIDSFKEKLNSQITTRPVQTNFLCNSQTCFQSAEKEQKLVIEGLLNDSEFITDFLEFSKLAETTDAPVTEAVLVTPALENGGVAKILKNVQDVQTKLSEEISTLNEIIKRLHAKNQQAQAIGSKEIKAVEKKYRGKIEKAKTALDAKIAKINKQYSEQISKVSSTYDQKNAALQKELVKSEKEKEDLEGEIEKKDSEIRTASINKDEVAEEKCKEKRNELKDKRPEISAKLKALDTQIKEAAESQKKDLVQLKQDNDAQVKEAGRDLMEIECARDAEVKVIKCEMEKIEDLTQNIIVQVDQIAKQRESTLQEFDSLGVKQKREEVLLVYMPFYLVCYQNKANKRYTFLAPSEVGSGSISTRLKGLGKTKIKQFLQPKNKKTTSILNSFIALMNENIPFCREISEACMKTNLLQTDKNQKALRSGLEKLKETDWISNSELEEFMRALS